MLGAASKCALSRGEDCIYLHVEPTNHAAVSLYESSGYKRMADAPPYASLTRALNLQERAVLYKREDIESDDS